MKNVEDIYPLTALQKGLLFHSISSPHSGLYFEQSCLSLTGHLDLDAFARCWQQVLDRHPALRTAFLWEDLDEPLQVVRAQVEFDLRLLDWTSLPAPDRRPCLDSLLQQDRQEGFRLDHAPLLRVTLVALADDAHHLIWSHHHLLLDGWSNAVVLDEVFTLYEGYRAGRQVRLEPVRPYRDYMAWLGKQDQSKAEQYWRRTLKGVKRATALVGEKARHSDKGEDKGCGEVRWAVSKEVSQGLSREARKQKVTLNTMLQCVWAIIMSRYSGQREVVFGAVVSGRPAEMAGVERMVGLMINTLPVRVRVNEEEEVREMMRRVQEEQAEQREYEYSGLMEVSQWSEMEVGEAMFDTLLVYENYPEVRGRGVEGGGRGKLEVRGESVYERTNYGLTVIAGGREEMEVRMSYDRRKYEEWEVERIVRQMEEVMRGIWEGVEKRVREVGMVSERERHQIEVEWNDTAREYERRRSVKEMFEEEARRRPDAVAVEMRGEQVSYGELNRRANRLGRYLRRKGVGVESKVGICVDRSIEMVVAVMGVLKAGGAYVPMEPGYPQERLTYMREEAEAEVVVTQRKYEEKFEGRGVEVIKVDECREQIEAMSCREMGVEVDEANLAYVIYTSGSTGKPKGVEVSHQNILRLVRQNYYANFGADEVFLQFAPLSFDASTFEIWGCLLNGGKLVVASHHMHSLEELGELIVNHQVNTLWLTASLFHLMVDQRLGNLESVGQLLAGGEALSARHVQEFLKKNTNTKLINGYGPTEGTTFTCCYSFGQSDCDNNDIPIGSPIANTRVYAVDKELRLVPIGISGELYISGEGLARGYLDQADLTAERFLPDPYSEQAGARMYRTGDVVRYIGNGNIEYLGRVDNQVKIRGYRIEPDEVEAVLSQCRQVTSCAVIVSSDENGEKRLLAYYTAREELEVSEVRDYLKSKLPEYMIPAAIEKLEQMPLTVNGKIDRAGLPRAEEGGGRSGSGQVAAVTPTQEIVKGVWEEVLSRRGISLTDNFFEQGGHSLLATRVISRIRKLFQVEIPLRSLFERPTVAELSREVDEALRASTGIRVPAIKAAGRQRELPLSFAQQRLWFLSQLEGETAAYNIPLMLRLRGKLNEQGLRRSLSRILRRHEVLRMRVEEVDGRPLQIIEEIEQIELGITDLREEEEADREREASAIAEREVKRGFDLSRGGLIRGMVIRMGEEDQILLLNMHHIVSDGWSMGILVRELKEMYRGEVRGEEVKLEEMEIQYGDYAVWQREWLRGEVLEEQMRYWKERLRGVKPVLMMGTDRRRPAEQSYRGRMEWFEVSEEVSERVKEMSRSEGATMFMTLLAAFDVLLMRYSGQLDILVATPVANRTHPEMEELIGFFVNTLVIRADLRGEPSFRELMGRVREACVGAYAHQDLPFEKLVEELQPERGLSHNPVFQVMFTYESSREEEVELEGLEVVGLGIDTNITELDLMLALEEGEGGRLKGSIEYSTDLFDATTIKRMHQNFHALLESIVSNPDQKISELQILTQAEQRQLLVEWNGTSKDYGQDVCLQKVFEAQAAQTPNSIAVACEQEQVSYEELNKRANQLANYLLRLGVGPEVRVGICVERSIEMIVGMLGILKAGGAYVPLDRTYPKDRLRYMLESSRAAVLLTQEHLLSLLPEERCQTLCIDSDWKKIASEKDANPTVAVTPDNIAYLIYTSGSTGEPRGVMIEHRSLVNYIKTAAELFKIKQDDRVLQFANICFDMSAEEIYPPLARGATLVLRNDAMLASVSLFLKKCRDWEITVLDLPTAYWHEVTANLSEDEEFPPSIRLVLFGGEKALRERLLAWQKYVTRPVQLLNGYGPTEATIVATFGEPDLLSSTDLTTEVTIGQAISNTEVYVLDKYHHLVPVIVPGEIYIAGAGVARGYLDRPDLTAEKFIPNPFAGKAGARMYRTGNRGRYLPDGVLEYLGRIDNQVKIRGYRIEPDEVEAVLSQCRQVTSCAVIVSSDENGEKRLLAYYTAREELEVSEVRDYLKSKLPEYMIPAAIEKLEQMPLTVNGKIDRAGLPRAEEGGGRSGSGQVAAVTPTQEIVKGVWGAYLAAWRSQSTTVEEMITAIWEEVLSRRGISLTDNFFEQGGHSLLATRVISRIRKLFQVEIPLRSLFERPTVAELSREVDEALRASTGIRVPAIKAAGRQRELPLSFAQQRLWFLSQLEGETAAYNIPLMLRLRGKLNEQGLRRSLSRILRRHEVLRMRVEEVDGRPLQIIEEIEQIELGIIDLREEEEADREREASAIAEREVKRGFDLSRGGLIRGMVIRMGEEDQILLLNMHHIVSDGWSMGILVRELKEMYRGEVRGEEVKLEEMEIQYGDYAVWQREWLRGEVLEEQMRYWKERLRGVKPVLMMGTDRRRPAEQSYRGRMEWFEVSEEVSERVKEMSRSEGATMFMTLLAAFDVLLMRYSGQLDILVGTSVANRSRSELEGLIGFFVNPLVIRADLRGEPSFRELMGRVREACVGAYAHQDLPFEKLVEELQPERGLSHNPVFQVMFTYESSREEEVELEGLEVVGLEMETNIAKFDLMLALEEGEGGRLKGSIEYSTDLFDATTIKRMVKQYKGLLEEIAQDVEKSINEIEILSEWERHQIEVEWNDTAADHPAYNSVKDMFEREARRRPDAVAVEMRGEQVSYGELNRRANRLGRYLRSKGVGVESKVGICVDRSIEMVVAVMGVLKAGGAYVPMEPGYPQERLTYMREEAEAEVVVTQGKYEEKFEGRGVEVIKVDECREQMEAMSCREMGVEVDEANLAYVIYTSGSTGKPKGVMIEQRGLVNYLIWAGRAYQSEGGRGTLVHTPVGFDLTVTSLLLPLVKGERVEMVSEQGGIEELAERLTKGGGYWLLKMTPAHVEAVTRLIGEQKVERAAEVIVIGGEALSYEQIKRWRGVESESKGRVINEYGPSETVVGCIVNEVGEEEGEGGVAIGRPISNARVYVMSESKRVESIGVEGEIYIGGAGVGRGYQKQAEETAERYVPDRYSERAGARMYRTGDVGRYQSDGKVEYIGRADNQVKVRGYRIELGEIEAVLSQHKQVRSCVVVARQEREAEKRLVCYYTSEGEVSREELREHLGRKLPEYMVPGMFIEMEQMPLTTNGKVDLRALPSADKHRATPDASSHLPVTPVERTLARIWQEVLRVEQVGVDDNFFELGGDSIFGIQVVARARQAGLKLAPKHLFQHQSISELARVATVCSATARDEESEGGEVALTPIQHWFFELGLKDVNHFNQAMIFESQERVDRRALEEAVEGVISHHEALRHSFRQEGGRWRQRSRGSQRVDEEGPIGREVVEEVDIREMSGQEEEREMDRAHKGLDISEGRMMKVLVMRGRESDRVLIVIHHLAIDVVSWAIVLEDLRRGYEQARRGEEVRIGERSGSYKQWAEELERYAKSDEVLREVEYWTGESKRVREGMRVDREGENEERSSEVEEVEVSEEVSERLMKEVSRAYRVRMNEVVLGAVVEGVGRWSGMRKVKIEVEGHGREEVGEIDVSRTVGWFTVIAPIVVERGREVEETLRRVKEEVRGMEKGGIGYGLLRYMRGDEEVSERIREMGEGEIIYNYLGRVEEVVGEEGGMKVRGGGGRSRGEGKRRYKLEVTGYVEGGKVKVEIGYSGGKYERESIREIKKGIGEAMEEMVERSSRAKGEEFSPADFPLVKLNAQQVEHLVRYNGDLQDIYPLTALQKGLLFHSISSPHSGLYFEQSCLSLTGHLDLDAFARCWQQVLDRHPALRTAFLWEDLDEPLQVVRAQVEFDLRLLDWTSLPAPDRRPCLDSLLQQDRQEGFRLDHAPLLRVTLVALADDAHHLIWSHHHLLLDGWSNAVVLDEVFTLYEGYRAGRQVRLEPVRPYRDYMAWLGKQDQSKAEQYWRRTLKGVKRATALVGEKARHSDKGEDKGCGEVRWAVSKEVSQGLSREARKQKVTLNTMLQCVWAIIMSRYSGQREVVFGAVVSGRPAEMAGVERMVGLMINTLPVRVRVNEEEEVREMMRRVQEEQAEQREYEYSGLMEVSQWSEMEVGEAMFDTLLVYENYPEVRGRGVEGGGRGKLEVRGESVYERTNYGLTVIAGGREEMEVRMSYDRRKYEEWEVERIVRQMEEVMRGIWEGEEKRVREVGMVSERERHQIEVEWNDTAREYERRRSVKEMFEEEARRRPDAVAVEMRGEQVSYGELNRRANRLGRYLRRKGVGVESKVGICVDRSIEMVVAVMGVLKAGGAYVPMEPGYPQERLTYMREEAEVEVVVTQRKYEEKFEGRGVEVIKVDECREQIEAMSCREMGVEVEGANLAYVIYTSGSTGKPKGVMITHRSAMILLQWAREVFENDLSEVLASTSICFDLSVFEIFVPLSFGGKVVVVENALELIKKSAATGMTLINTVPSAIAELVRESAVPESVRVVNLAGEALQDVLVEKVYNLGGVERVVNLYGPTEDTTYSTYDEVGRGQKVTIGRPVANTRVYILDERFELATIGITGELFISGEGLARGYMNRPEMTAEKFIPDPYSERAGARMYRTGDVGRYQSDGKVEYIGRADNQVKVRGYRIELGEIEAVLSQHKQVRSCVVVARQEREAEKRLVCYYTSEGEVRREELREHLGRKLPEYMVPGMFIEMEQMPLTANGKVDRSALPVPGKEEQSVQNDFLAPRDGLERELVQIWEEILSVAPIGIRDDFFRLGGNSLIALRMVAAVRRRVAKDLPISVMLQARTIQRLAAILRRKVPSLTQSPLVAIQPQGRRPNLFCIHPGSGNVLCYIDLARRLGTDQPVYGLQDPTLFVGGDPAVPVEIMAANYIEAMRTVQPRGPYFLIGWSFGGLVAFEMARQLREDFQEIGLLGLFDTAAPENSRAFSEASDDAFLLYIIASELGLPVASAHLRQLEPAERFVYINRLIEQSNIELFDDGEQYLRRQLEVFKARIEVSQNYFPRIYRGRVTLFRASEKQGESLELDAVADPSFGWANLSTEEVEVLEVPGTHANMAREPHVRVLAEVISSRIKGAPASASSYI